MNILVVDDQRYILQLFQDVLATMEGHQVACEHSGYRAVVQVKDREFDLVFLDVVMPGLDGLRTIDEIQRLRPGTRIVIITGHAGDETIDEAVRRGADRCLRKPFGITEIKDVVDAISAQLPADQ